MSKRYKNPTAPPVPAGAPAAAALDLAALHARVEALFDRYLALGCPCRFPRFRALVEEQFAPAIGPPLLAQDQQALIYVFDRRVPLTDQEKQPVGHRGRCEKCGARVERWFVEHFKGAWIEYLTIVPAPGAIDIGAPVDTPIPHCGPLFAAGPADGRDRSHSAIERDHPRVPVDDWFAWLEATRG
jgi:hypothetical protein